MFTESRIEQAIDDDSNVHAAWERYLEVHLASPPVLHQYDVPQSQRESESEAWHDVLDAVSAYWKGK